MASCEQCTHWLIRKQREYESGEVKVDFQAAQGKGQCEKLGIETPENFYCAAFMEDTGYDHVAHVMRDGAAWMHWKMGPCPNCRARGCAEGGENVLVGACDRCAGTGQVRYYEDGHVGEERTRLHPIEKEQQRLADIEKRRAAAQAILDGLPPPPIGNEQFMGSHALTRPKSDAVIRANTDALAPMPQPEPQP